MLGKKGRSGFSFLIMFIVILIICAIAASVVVLVNNKFSEKALITGKAAKNDASAEVELLDVYVEDGTTKGIDFFFMTFKVGPSSNPTNLNMTFFGLSLSNSTGEYHFADEADCNNMSTLVPGSTYGTNYLIKGRDYLDGRVTRGDVVTMCYRTPRRIMPGEMFKIHIVTITGSRILFDYQLPDIIYNKRTLLYP